MPTTTRRHTLELAGLEVPVIELAGAGDGPRLTVLAGVHGCEYASMAAVRRWARGLEDRDLRGRVVAVPVLNLPAFRARSPFVVPDDGKNLNRCFPGDPAGTLADRLAHATFTRLISGSDALVDVHAGDMVEALEPFALYDAGPAEVRARELATAYGLGYVVRSEPGPGRAVGGSTSAAAAEAGIPAIIATASFSASARCKPPERRPSRRAACVSRDRTTCWCLTAILAHRARATGLRCCTKVANSSPRGSRLNRSSPGIPMRDPAASRTKSGVLRRTSQPSTRRPDRTEPSFRPSARHPRRRPRRTSGGASSRTARAHCSGVPSTSASRRNASS